MPKYDFDFEIVSNAEGKVVYQKRIDVPVRIKLKRLHLITTDSCEARSHRITVRVNGEVWTDSMPLLDCEPFQFSKTLKTGAGELTVTVESEGFDPQEPVRGEGWIEYGLAML